MGKGRGKRQIQDIDNEEFLNRFPIFYKREDSVDSPCLRINPEAQDIFS